jgi:hypothetical protein
MESEAAKKLISELVVGVRITGRPMPGFEMHSTPIAAGAWYAPKLNDFVPSLLE